MKLKSTKETIFPYPWTGEGPQPWPKEYKRVLRPLSTPTKSGNRADLMLVHVRNIS